MASTSTNPARAPELAEHQERLNELGWRIQSVILKYRELVNAHEDEDVRNDISWKFLNGLHREMDEVYFVLGWISGCTLGESAGQIPSSIRFLQQFSLWQSSIRGYSIAIKRLKDSGGSGTLMILESQDGGGDKFRAKDILMRNAATMAFLDEVIDVNQAAAGEERKTIQRRVGRRKTRERTKNDEEEDNRMVE
ncbi:hypothetical protein BXZ70DRAFT_1013015 [Cristinia sonorae]|uniref:Uncharacterized protein n=1 Tax=Cristinia sonorae TaxID=1940300 RepID=A0A8K0XJT6_9AGAR|nr:hypothetical protein BXZ70DRAFT_1013015 [Cristinia sonorae]